MSSTCLGCGRLCIAWAFMAENLIGHGLQAAASCVLMTTFYAGTTNRRSCCTTAATLLGLCTPNACELDAQVPTHGPPT